MVPSSPDRRQGRSACPYGGVSVGTLLIAVLLGALAVGHGIARQDAEPRSCRTARSTRRAGPERR